MTSSSEPSIHRGLEQQFVAHVQRLLDDDRLRIDTTRGRRPLAKLSREVTSSDRSVDLKRLMSEMNRPDRELQSQMPIGQSIEVTVSQRKWLLFSSEVGRLKVVCVSPTRALIAGEPIQPLRGQD